MSMNTFVSGKFLRMNKTLIAVKSVFAGCFLDSSFLLFLSQDAGKDPPSSELFFHFSSDGVCVSDKERQRAS